MDCIWSRDVLCVADLERKGFVPSRSGALQHDADHSGWGVDTFVGHAVLIVWDDYVGSVWIFERYDALVFLWQLLWMVSTDPICVWGENANPVAVWFLDLAHYVVGFRWSLCVAHWHIEQSGAMCSPQAGLQHTHCSFSVEDGEALASYSLLELNVSAMSSLQVITDVQMRGLINIHKWKYPILS